MSTRREMLAWSLAGVAGLKLGCRPLGSEHPEIVTTPTAGTFEITATSAIAWVHAEAPTDLVLELEHKRGLGVVPGGTEPPEPRITTRPVATSAASGFCARVDLDALAPDQGYRFRVRKDERVSDWHHFRTAPAPGADAVAHFLVSADVHIAAESAAEVFATMASTPARFLVSLGDWPYSDRPPRAKTLDQFRERIRVSRLRRNVRRMMTRLPLYAIYDDHELTNDWDARFRERKPARLAAGLQAWDEWFPTRGVTADVRYRSWSWGKHVELFLLDTRLYRSSNKAPDDENKTMLGATQKAWLIDALARSRATFKIILSSIPFDFGTTPEHWNAFTHERRQLEEALVGVPGLLVISGDQHWFAAHRHGSGIREFQVGPMQAFTRRPPPVDDAVIARIETANFGEIRIDPGVDGLPPRLRFTARGTGGAILYQEDFDGPEDTRASRAPGELSSPPRPS